MTEEILQRPPSMKIYVYTLLSLHIHSHLFIISTDLSTTGWGEIPSVANDLVHALNKSV